MSCGCDNPCDSTVTNTAANESLQSQIENFTLHFFGTVVKTEVDGEVNWVLPCNLEVGLENNPRAEGEGLACYFLRLFQDGITGATGPQGLQGDGGTDGNNAYTVTLSGFTQPTEGSPNVSVLVSENPAILESLYVFIQTSGWYFVNNVASGTLSLTLAKAVSSPPATVSAGKLVVPAGFPGESVTGPQGPQGPQGEQGTPGESFTETNSQYLATVGTDYALQVAYDAVDFVNSSPELLLPDEGTYLLTAVVELEGLTGVLDTDLVSLKLRNVDLSLDIAGSEKTISYLHDGQRVQVVISVQVETDDDNWTVSLFGKCTSADKVNVLALSTVYHYVRLA